MLTKYILESKEFAAEVIVLRDLKFIKTFTVDEFKSYFGVSVIKVKRHPKGFLFFQFKEVIGLVTIRGIPQNPRISIAVGKFGIPHYLLHEADDIRDSYTIDFDPNVPYDIEGTKLCDDSETICKGEIGSDARILASYYKYDILNDNRFLIPFTERAKIGFINHESKTIIPASFDIVLDDFYNSSSLVRVGEIYGVAFERKTSAPAVYLRKRYGLLKSDGEMLLPIEFEDIIMPVFSSRIVIRSYGKGYAVIDYNGNIIVPFGRYDYIDGFDMGLSRVKLGKVSNGIKDSDDQWGIIDECGNEVLKPIYKNIWNFYNKSRQYTRVESEDRSLEFHFAERQLMQKGYQKEKEAEIQRGMNNYRALQNYSESTYDEYNGSYTQDIMGYSDQDIDDAFDGDPEAYWNID